MNYLEKAVKAYLIEKGFETKQNGGADCYFKQIGGEIKQANVMQHEVRFFLETKSIAGITFHDLLVEADPLLKYFIEN